LEEGVGRRRQRQLSSTECLEHETNYHKREQESYLKNDVWVLPSLLVKYYGKNLGTTGYVEN